MAAVLGGAAGQRDMAVMRGPGDGLPRAWRRGRVGYEGRDGLPRHQHGDFLRVDGHLREQGEPTQGEGKT